MLTYIICDVNIAKLVQRVERMCVLSVVLMPFSRINHLDSFKLLFCITKYWFYN